MQKARRADQSHSIGLKYYSPPDCKALQRGGTFRLVSLASFGALAPLVVLSKSTNSPVAPPPIAPAKAPSVPPTNTPTGPAIAAPTAAPAAVPATKPPPIKTDFDSRSASSGLRATCAERFGSCDGTPCPGTDCLARSGSTGFSRVCCVLDEFICVPWEFDAEASGTTTPTLFCVPHCVVCVVKEPATLSDNTQLNHDP